eukprot:CAMPEP_0194394050 /NCGR_PEP_ID=MMETSP0174-20130528/123639_1 /TAXON_ID=216777 /ORGANISM="Proboscia alata, Strain PI-D3" /LENGTH=760 /DNA_ID=CAMNT_0039189805 /DNA_START=47 /DNA_END=2329 /DNA_ORIENTATION=+
MAFIRNETEHNWKQSIEQVDKSSHSDPNAYAVSHLEWDAVVNFQTRSIRAKAKYDIKLGLKSTNEIRLDSSPSLIIHSITDNESCKMNYSLSTCDLKKPHLGRCLSIIIPSSLRTSALGKTLQIVIIKFGLKSTNEIRLDSSPSLIIHSITDNESCKMNYSLSTCDLNKPHLGRCLSIIIPSSLRTSALGKTLQIVIEYETTDGCSALQWLPSSQTAGGKYPYLFTQCQAIHARSLLPCMDCPGVKFTYEARVTTPSWATSVMSALSTSTTSSEDTKTFLFEQRVPIPSYLLALAVGQIESVDISPRCRVWAEPSIVKAAAFEFDGMEAFLSAAEEITQLPYPWKRYDLLCLPPSFPYGGMENPCLTFVTPTLLAGDKSLADVVAHEIAHSWTGNLVTNLTWEHFWLNEGYTMWLQRKIMCAVNNDPLLFDFDAIGGFSSLKESVEMFPDDYTRLIPVLGDADPDDAFSSIPYEKGFHLLYVLERKVGSESFLSFTRAYLQKYKYGSITSEEFQSFFEKYFEGNKEADGVDWERWLHEPGMPIEVLEFDRTLSKASEELAEAWIAYDVSNGVGVAPTTDIAGWSSSQITCVLDTMLDKTNAGEANPLKLSTVKEFGDMYGLKETKNSEILFRYCRLAIHARDEDILPVVVHFITTQGRMKYIRPLYQDLFTCGYGVLAVKTFVSKKDFYHPIAAKMLAVDLKISVEKGNHHVQGEQEEENTQKVDQNTIKVFHDISSNKILIAIVIITGFAGIFALRRRK